MISKYLKALIESNNRIIIPDFGAFMVQDTSEGKQITFNDFLKFNDGLLINQIIKTDKISKNEATDKVKEFVSSVEKSFTEKKPYHIEGLGYLSKDGHSNIKFEAKLEEAKTKKASATDVKPTIELADEPKKTPAKKEDKPAAEKANSKSDAAPKSEQKEVKKPVAKEEPVKPAPTVQAKATEQKKEELTKEEPAKQATTATSIHKPSDKKTNTVITKKSNSNTSTIVIAILVAIILLSAGAWLLMKIGVIGGDKTPTSVVVEVPVPIVQDTIVEDTVVEEPVVVEEPAMVQEEAKYYLIGGSFKVVSNAERFNQKLINEGYNSEIIVRSNGFNCVSYKSFMTWDEVIAEWRTMKSTTPNIWILIK